MNNELISTYDRIHTPLHSLRSSVEYFLENHGGMPTLSYTDRLDRLLGAVSA